MKKVLLVGDSIRQGYEKYVSMAFEDTAQVFGPKDCGRFAAYVLRYIGIWKAQLKCGDVDLIHWNAGLWDCLRMGDGLPHTELPIYEYYLNRVCDAIERLFPNAQQIFATSTAVREERFTGILKRYNADIEAFNDVAVKVVTARGAKINDLYAVTKDAPIEVYSDSTHFNTAAGTKLVTEPVIACIASTLGITAKQLDYDKQFAKQTEIIGI